MNYDELVKTEKDLKLAIDTIYPSDGSNFPNEESFLKAMNNCTNIFFLIILTLIMKQINQQKFVLKLNKLFTILDKSYYRAFYFVYTEL